MQTKPSILELLAEQQDTDSKSTKVAIEMAPASLREQDGEMYVDIRVATDAVIDRWGAFDGDEFIADYDQKMVLDGIGNIDDTRLKNGIPLIDSHNTYSILGQFGMSQTGEKAWWIEGGALFATFKLSAIAKMTGVADSIKNQTIKFVSIGAMILKDSWDRTGPKPLRTITLVQPYEVSLVVAGAIPDAMILSMNNPKLKELLMSTVAKPAATTQTVPPVVAPADPVAPETVELTAEQIADEALKLAGLPARGSKVVLDAGNKEVAVILEAAKLLDLHAEVEKGRTEGKTLAELKVLLSASAKARAVKLAAADKSTTISTDLPMPTQATSEQGAKKTWGGVALSIIKQNRERAAGR